MIRKRTKRMVGCPYCVSSAPNFQILGGEKRVGRVSQQATDADSVNRMIKFSGVTDDTVGREEIIEILCDVDFTSFERGKTHGFCLLKPGTSANDVVNSLEKNPGKAPVDRHDMTHLNHKILSQNSLGWWCQVWMLRRDRSRRGV